VIDIKILMRIGVSVQVCCDLCWCQSHMVLDCQMWLYSQQALDGATDCSL